MTRWRMKSIICVAVVSAVIWTSVFVWIKTIIADHPYSVFKLYPKILLGAELPILAVVLTMAKIERVSCLWPILMSIIAILIVAGLTPVEAVGPQAMREILSSNPYYLFTRRTIGFITFVLLQILGILLAKKRASLRTDSRSF